MRARGGYIYILTNKYRTTLYIGVTSNLHHRITEHREGRGSNFTSKYGCRYLIHWEFYPRIEEAINREKQLKKWKREWKDQLIREKNPNMADLYSEITEMQ